jgi:hypothetical protein
VSEPELAMPLLRELIEELGDVEHVYVTRRWRLIAWLMQVVPDALYARL